jgi:hypothetical protein
MKNITKLSQEEKEDIYNIIDKRILKGTKMRILDAGFPKIVIECGNIRIITDVQSFEVWGLKKKRL